MILDSLNRNWKWFRCYTGLILFKIRNEYFEGVKKNVQVVSSEFQYSSKIEICQNIIYLNRITKYIYSSIFRPDTLMKHLFQNDLSPIHGESKGSVNGLMDMKII